MRNPAAIEHDRQWHKKPLFSHAILVFLFAALVLLIYVRVLLQPFVQDDWAVMYRLKTATVPEIIGQAFLPAGSPMYRPLGMVYFLVMFNVFGVHPPPFHIVGLLLHIGNSLLVGLTILRITERKALSLSVALLYAAASTIHGDPLLWMVGFYDLAGVFFFFSSLLLYLRSRPILSAVAFALCLLTKEATAVLPLVLIAHAFLLERSRLKQLWLHAVLLTVYIVTRLAGVDFLAFEPSDPYRVELVGEHIVSNLALFSEWAFEVIFPFLHPRAHVVAGLAALSLVLLAFAIVLRKSPVVRLKLRQSLFFMFWMIVGVAPVLFLKHHLFRYYAVYALAPFLTLVLLYAEAIFPRIKGRWWGVALAVLITANVVGNWISFNDSFRREPGSVAIFDGTNHLIRKGSVVRSAQSELLRRYPSLPRNSQLVISGLETEAFLGEIGPRIWYDDTSLEVYTAAEFDSLLNLGIAKRNQVYFLEFAADTLMQ